MTGLPLAELHANSKFSSLPLAASAARKAHKIETIGVVKPAVKSEECVGIQRRQTPQKPGDLARIFHRQIEQRSGESVRRLEITQPNENATHRFF